MVKTSDNTPSHPRADATEDAQHWFQNPASGSLGSGVSG